MVTMWLMVESRTDENTMKLNDKRSTNTRRGSEYIAFTETRRYNPNEYKTAGEETSTLPACRGMPNLFAGSVAAFGGRAVHSSKATGNEQDQNNHH